MSEAFTYAEAFKRNLGWVSVGEQDALRGKVVAIAGLGGVGGVHMLTLARLGIGSFRIADFDTFSVANFNRQAGASVSTLDQPKLDVLRRMTLDINPEAQVVGFEQGVDETNVDQFLEGVDVYVDGLDFFAFDARQCVFAACARLGVPAVTVAPVGMGAALLTFLPGRMTFEEYFQWERHPPAERAVRFLIGLAPAALHRNYLVDISRVNMEQRQTPSTIMACQICAGIAATEALKILLGRGPVRCAPHGMQFDAYRNKLVRTWRPWGNRHPFQRLTMWLAQRQLARIQRTAI